MTPVAYGLTTEQQACAHLKDHLKPSGITIKCFKNDAFRK